MRRVFGLLWTSLLLAGCSTTHVAPVVDLTGANPAVVVHNAASVADQTPNAHLATHVVQKGDTLYSIALEYGLDYRELAAWNHLDDVNHIRIGETLQVAAADAGSSSAAVQASAIKAEIVTTQMNAEVHTLTQPQAIKLPYSQAAMAQLAQAGNGMGLPAQPGIGPKPVASADKASVVQQANDAGLDWTWPADGRVIAGFDDAKNSKGIDISGSRGQPVFAAAAGKVVYSGAGLHGYGKLVIIKHNASFLTAYAHNQQILVKEGQTVSRGQKIAEMGDSDANQVELHFEVRQMGKPVDPLKYLPQASK